MSKERAKGTSWETAIVNYLAPNFPTVRRTGSADFGGGDIAGLGPDALIEAKNVARIDLATIVAQVEAASTRTNRWLAAAWIKKRGKSNPADGYVVMSGLTFRMILLALIEVDEEGRT